MAELLRDRYFWSIAVLLGAAVLITYPGESYILGVIPTESAWHTTLSLSRGILFLVIVAITSWRFGVKGGLAAWLAVVLILLPHLAAELTTQSQQLAIQSHSVVLGVVGLAFIWLIGTRKRAEEVLRESEEKYRGIFNKVPTSMILLDKDGQIVDINPYHVTHIGKGKTTQKDYLGKNIVAHPSIVNAGLSETYARLLKGEAFDLKDVYFPTTTGGADGYFNVKGVPIFKGGRVVAAIAMHEDITERKQAEEALRQSEAKYKGLVTNVKLGIFRSTPGRSGRFLEVNPAMEEITGYSREELLQMDVSDLYVHPEEREALLEEIASAIGVITKELPLRKKDGTEIVVSDTKVAVRDDNGKVTYFDGIIEDITERKRAEEKEKELQAELYLSSRLAAIGELAAGVAHEMNNPLTGIMGFSKRLLKKSTDEKARKDLERIHGEALRMAKVVENLLTFARHREPKREYADINDILQKALELRAYELKTSNIEVETSLATALPKTMVDFYQVQEVFLNIIINAEQAMVEANHGGKLGIKTRQGKGYIMITFTDDGPGISAEHLDKVFNPFFTTRGEKGGTGLGLSVCYSIVSEHDGRIYAKSTPGKGATFFVELPLTAENMERG